MKTFKLSLLICLILTLTISAFSQRKFGGKVVEVLDGKTAVVQMYNGGKLTVVLQYVEIPEADQPLYETVREHLQQLILDRDIEISPRGVSNSKTVGQVTLKGVDISQQMIRDGAAWHATLESGGQNTGENANYQKQEAQAKAEKRGVWSIEGMKPAWEFRAAKEEAKKAAERAEWEAIKAESQAKQIAEADARRKNREEKQSAARDKNLGFDSLQFDNLDAGAWAKMGASGAANTNGLIINRYEKYNAQLISTTSDLLNLSDGKRAEQLQCHFGYFSFRHESVGEKEFFAFACISESNKEVSKSKQLTLVTDGKKTIVNKTLQLRVKADEATREFLIYNINRNFVLNIAQADKVQIKIGEFSGSMPENLHSMTKSLVLEISK